MSQVRAGEPQEEEPRRRGARGKKRSASKAPGKKKRGERREGLFFGFLLARAKVLFGFASVGVVSGRVLEEAFEGMDARTPAFPVFVEVTKSTPKGGVLRLKLRGLAVGLDRFGVRRSFAEDGTEFSVEIAFLVFRDLFLFEGVLVGFDREGVSLGFGMCIPDLLEDSGEISLDFFDSFEISKSIFVLLEFEVEL